MIYLSQFMRKASTNTLAGEMTDGGFVTGCGKMFI